ncbi:hypothetical protein POM88_000401 [Heracleum sosnowskyi]|uniref:Uncharacterized protein n=1 Tax=Heracleum sosnowskyi TaxID=360622 RepID=A0AAD8JDW4_9APIA|nr:hypothetical protein POM88_000401 [Heracleum sosnowskyi]
MRLGCNPTLPAVFIGVKFVGSKNVVMTLHYGSVKKGLSKCYLQLLDSQICLRIANSDSNMVPAALPAIRSLRASRIQVQDSNNVGQCMTALPSGLSCVICALSANSRCRNIRVD